MSTSTIYAGKEYRFDGENFTVSTSRKEVLADYEVKDEFQLVHSDFVPCRDVPPRVRRILREQWEDLLAEKAAQAKAAAAWQAKKAELAAQARGVGQFRCPVCGHRQDLAGECEHCGDGIVA